MRIFVTGEEGRVEELKQKLPGAELHVFGHLQDVENEFSSDTVVFDLNLDDQVYHLETYGMYENLSVFGCAVKMQLADMLSKVNGEIKCRLAGINALPTFINRELAEISFANEADEKATSILDNLGWKYRIVADRVGMVSPRVIFMIINEAFFTLQEGTASASDIDLGMKLGTNYPRGPFEWVELAGVRNVYETLEAVYLDTRDERYKICPLLKSAYLKSM